MSELYSLKLEKQALSGLLKFPDLLGEIDHLICPEIFFNKFHRSCFGATRSILEKGKKIDKVLLSESIRVLKIKFKDEIDIFGYIEGLFESQVTRAAALETFQELVKLKVCRELVEKSEEAKKFVAENKDKGIAEIITGVDRINNEKIFELNRLQNGPIDLFEDLENFIEAIGNNPPDTSKFYLGPFEGVNRMLGSLLRPGNICNIISRSGVGKSSIGMFYLTWVAAKYDIPILHLDFGEMTPDELRFRATSMFTKGKVSYYDLETGDWRKNEEMVKQVREVWSKVKKLKYYFEDISTKSGLEIINLIRRFAFNKIGRGNPFIVHYDYLKPIQENSYSPEWAQIGYFMQNIKSFITGEVNIPFWTSLQSNRAGIVTNKKSSEVDDSENIASLSDRIFHNCSHVFILRSKTLDEIALENNEFGNLKLIPIKHRHLGKDRKEIQAPVLVKKGLYKKNYYNLDNDSFWFEEKGDLRSMIKTLQEKYEAEEQEFEEAAI